jgi:ferrochelatase
VDPLGFVCDHLETLYDLDIEARAWASELGLEFSRVPALNDSPQLTKALASVALRAFAQAPSPQPQ